MILPITAHIDTQVYKKAAIQKHETHKLPFKEYGLARDTVSFSGLQAPKLNEKTVDFFSEMVKCCIDNPAFLQKNKSIISKTLEEIMPAVISGSRNNESGMRGFVSRLDDNFVVKVPHWFKNATPACIKDHCSRGRVNPNRFAALQDYYGHHIISFGDIGIMKNATAPGTYVRVGRPYEKPINEGGFEYYTEEYLPTCSQLPQESFDRLARNLRELNSITLSSGKYYFEPDTENPNNFLIFNNQIRIVDDLDPTQIENPNNIVTMLKPLLTKISTVEEAHIIPELISPRREILKKCIIASTKENLPLMTAWSDERIFEQACELSGLEKEILALKNSINQKDVKGLEEIFAK